MSIKPDLFYKPDWLEARERLTAWWEGKPVDRAVAMVRAPVEPAKPARTAYINTAPQKYTDPDTVFNNLEYGLERSYYGGEALPFHFVYFGPMFSAAYFGAEPHFTVKTTYYEPAFDAIEDMLEIEFDENNRWWRENLEMTRLSAERSRGRYLTTIGGISSMMDMICGLLGNEKTMMAMIEKPGAVKSVCARIGGYGKPTYDFLYDIILRYNAGTIDWLGAWCPKKLKTNQCDASVMFSPDMFREFVAPEIESTYDYVDYGLYHLDGEEQIRHLDTLLSMKKLRVIQWVPSARHDPDYRSPFNWLDLFRRIQAGGKSVMISHCPPERVGELLNKIDRRLVILRVNCPDRETAEGVLRELDRIGV